MKSVIEGVTANRGRATSGRLNQQSNRSGVVIVLVCLVCLIASGCKVTHKTIQRETFSKDFEKIRKGWELTHFQDSVMKDLQYLSISTDAYLKAIRPPGEDTTSVDPGNFLSTQYFDDLKEKKVTYFDLLAEAHGYESELRSTRQNKIGVTEEIENKCRCYQKDVEQKIDSASNLFNYRLTELEQRDSSTVFGIVITRQNVHAVNNLSLKVLFYRLNSNIVLFDLPLECPGEFEDTISIRKAFTDRDFSNPSYDYFRSVLNGKDYEMKFVLHRMNLNGKPYVSPYNYYYYKLNSFLWSDGECPYFSETETRKLTKTFQQYVKDERTLIDRYPILSAKDRITHKEIVRMTRNLDQSHQSKTK